MSMQGSDAALPKEVPRRTPLRGRVLCFAGFRRVASELPRAIDFYCEALGFSWDGVERAGEWMQDSAGHSSLAVRCAALTLGRESIELVAPLSGDANLASAQFSSVGTAFQHVAIVASDIEAAVARLRRVRFTAISTGGVVRLPKGSGGVGAYKFLDPDGHPLEFIHFPEGSGNPRWHPSGQQATTLGIDHSAVVVRDVEQSLSFYVGRLGFVESARQLNHGPEQDRLDGLQGTSVDVVTLMTATDQAPHLELLAYRAPALPLAPQVHPFSDRLVWQVDDLAGIGHSVSVAGLGFGSGPGTFTTEPPPSRETLIRDPDGHAHLLRGA